MSIQIDNVSSYTDTSAAVTQATSGGELGKDAFLRLLVAQMQHQDPLNPQGNEEFVAQLAQFSSLEQLVTANSALDALYMATLSMNNAAMTQLLGMHVEAYSDTFSYGGEGEQEIYYEALGAADSGTLNIYDEDGDLVRTVELGEIEVGDGSWTWDGKDLHGNQMEEGQYTVSINAETDNGDSVEVLTIIHGEVDGMTFEAGTPVPQVEGVAITLAGIISLGTDAETEDESESEGEEDDTIDEDGNAP